MGQWGQRLFEGFVKIVSELSINILRKFQEIYHIFFFCGCLTLFLPAMGGISPIWCQVATAGKNRVKETNEFEFPTAIFNVSLIFVEKFIIYVVK